VLLLHRHLAHSDVVAGLAAATGIGAARADVVAVEARRIAEHRPSQGFSSQDDGGSASVPAQRVISLTERRLGDPAAVIAGLPADTRPLPTVAAYDELLTPHRGRSATRRPPRSDRQNRERRTTLKCPKSGHTSRTASGA
jgi:hypothetical protein